MRVSVRGNNTLLLEEKVSRLIPKMAVPTIIAQLITTVYNLVDTYFVSTLGTNATAAVGVNGSLERTITIVGSLIGAGACSYISRLLGEKKQNHANQVLTTSLLTGIGIGFLFMILCLLYVENLVGWLGATAESTTYSMQYAQYVLYAAPFMIGSFILNMCLRSEGSATYSMIGIGFGGILNCFLDPLFIYGLHLGVAGASMATAISKFVSFMILLYPYIKKTSAVEISLTYFKYVSKDVKEVIAIGSISFVRSALTVVAAIAINRVAGGFSTAALAALSVANRVMEFPFAIILGFGQGYQPVVGFNWGAKMWARVKESLVFSCKVSIFGSMVIATIIGIFAGPIVKLFNSQADTEVLRLGILCIQLQCFALPIHAMNSIINMFYAGVGYAKESLVINTARQGYLFFPVLYLVPMFFGINGVSACQAVADMLSLLIVIPYSLKAFNIIKIKSKELSHG